MSDSLCPECAQPGFVAPGPCDYCGYAERLPLNLKSEAGVGRRISCKTKCNQNWAKLIFDDESRFWDKREQFSVFHEDSLWILAPNASAVNETLLNGVAITQEQELQEGDQIAVGRESKNIEKTILTVSFG